MEIMIENQTCPQCGSETVRCGAPNQPEKACCPVCQWEGPWIEED